MTLKELLEEMGITITNELKKQLMELLAPEFGVAKTTILRWFYRDLKDKEEKVRALIEEKVLNEDYRQETRQLSEDSAPAKKTIVIAPDGTQHEITYSNFDEFMSSWIALARELGYGVTYATDENDRPLDFEEIVAFGIPKVKIKRSYKAA